MAYLIHAERFNLGTGWRNCEWRTYSFDQTKDEANLIMFETSASLTRKDRNSTVMTTEEQSRTRVTALRSWADLGYIILN